MAEAVNAERYLAQSHRYEAMALRYLRQGDWALVPELLWGSLAATVKAVASKRGVTLATAEDVREFADALAEESGDARVSDAFQRVDQLGESVATLPDTRFMLDHLYVTIEQIMNAIRRFRSLVEPPATPRRRPR